jgi:hypothetical protein
MRNYVLIFILSMAFFQSIYAGGDNSIIVIGEISNKYLDKETVSVSTILGQEMKLKKSLFPKNFEFKVGNKFEIEIPAGEFPSK